MPDSPMRSDGNATTHEPVLRLREPRWTFDCTECDVDTYGGPDVLDLMRDHVRETGHRIIVTERRLGVLGTESNV